MALNLADLIINNSEPDIINILNNIYHNNKQEELDLNEIDRFGFRPLIEAVICNKPKVLLYLLEKGAEVDQIDVLGRTPLQWAIERSNIAACKILLNHKANPNHYSLDGQPILVYPILRQQLELIELLKKYQADYTFAQDFISAKLIGHRFELTGEADIVSNEKKFIPMHFEGFYLEFTISLIYRSLYNFIHSIQGQNFNNLHGKLYKILNALQHAATLASFAVHKDKSLFIKNINNILQEPLLLIPSAYSGHAITFIKYNNYLAKCDRGVNNITDTVIIYKVGNKYLLNDQFVYKLLYEPKTDDFVHYQFKQDLSLTPIKALPTRSQIAGNCSFANVETSIPAMLYLLLSDNEESTNIAEQEAYNLYKLWIEWDQDSALDEAIEDFHNASAERQLSKATILGSILIQRCNSNVSKHVDRAKKILNILTMPPFQFILRNYAIIYNKTIAGVTGENVMNLIHKYGITEQDIKYLILNKQLPTKPNFSAKQANKKTSPNPELVNPDLVKMTTALHVACLENNIDTVKYLIDKLKIDVNYLDRTGSTALMYAAWKGHTELVKLLVINYKANPKIKNYNKGTAKKYAALAGHTDIVQFLKDY